MPEIKDLPTPPPPSETPMTDRRICPTCCHFRDADVPCSDAFHIAPPSETKLSEALDDWERSFVDFVKWCTDPEFELRDSDREGINFGAVRLARSSLESLYREQMTELVELRDIKAFAAHKLQQYLEELSALRSLQITPEEASKFIWLIENSSGSKDPDLQPLRERLKKLSKVTP